MASGLPTQGELRALCGQVVAFRVGLIRGGRSDAVTDELGNVAMHLEAGAHSRNAKARHNALKRAHLSLIAAALEPETCT
jgi:hypothetical protein